MNLKEFAKSRNLTLPKLKGLCDELLGTVPEELTTEQQEKLDDGLLTASQSLLALSEQEDEHITPLSQDQLPDSTQRVKEIVGIETLQKNLLLYLQLAKAALQAKKFEQDTLAFQAEQAFYGDLAQYQHQTFQESLNRINKASTLTHWDGIRKYQPNAEDAKDCTLHGEIIELMDALGL